MPGAPQIARRRRWAPPAALARIDWSHPLTRGLDSYVLCQSATVHDLVTMTAPDSFAASPTVEPSPRSMGWMQDMGNGPYWSIAAKPDVAPPFSVFTWHVNPNNTNRRLVCTGTTTNGWSIATGAVATALRFRRGTAATDIGSAFPAAVTEITMAVTVTSANDLSAYVDGALKGTASLGSFTAATTFGLGLGSGHDGTNFTGTLGRPMGLAAVWRRALTAAEVVQMHADPFQLLRF